MARNRQHHGGLSSRAIIGRFYNRLEQASGASWVGPLSMYFMSDQESETYRWLGQVPTMREWVGQRQAKGLRENGITIPNLTYEASLEIQVDDLRRDKTGQILVRVDELADRAEAHWQKLLAALIVAGESTVCYDGQFFFDTDHTEGDSGTQSNDIAVDISAAAAAVHGTPTAPSPEELREMVLTGAQQIIGLKDDQGEPMNENAREFTVMTPLSYWKSAAAALNNPVLGGGDTNVMTNLDGYTFRLASSPRLSWTDKLAVFRTDGSTKPFIRQEEEEVTLQVIAEGSEMEIKEKKHLYGVEAIRNVGYGMWQHACLVQAT